MKIGVIQASSQAGRKLKDTERLKAIRATAQLRSEDFLKQAEQVYFENCLKKEDVIRYVLKNGNETIKMILKSML